MEINQLVPCIVNEIDRPCDRLIAIPVSVEPDGTALFRYLNIDATCSGPIRAATSIADFGRELLPRGGGFVTEETMISRVKLPDGRVRRWQPEPGDDPLRHSPNWNGSEHYAIALACDVLASPTLLEHWQKRGIEYHMLAEGITSLAREVLEAQHRERRRQ